MTAVCHIFRYFFPLYSGGVEHYIYRLSNHFSSKRTCAHNMRFYLLTEHFWGLKKIEKYGFLRVFRIGYNSFPGFLAHRRIAGYIYPHLIRDFMYCHLGYLEAAKIISVKKINIFHCHSFDDAQLSYKLSKRFKKPLIFTFHGRFNGKPEDVQLNNKNYTFLDRSDIIICNRLSTRSKLEEIGFGGKSYFIPNFVDTKLYSRPKYAKNHPFSKNLLFVGRLTARKDPITPILAFKHILKEIPDSKLYVVGYGPLYEQLENLTRKLGLERKIILYGRQVDIRRILWDSDIFLATSPFDNYPSLSLREAMASGLGIVATDVGETGAIIRNRENGLLVSPQDPESLGEAVIALLKNHKLLRKLSEEAQHTVEEFDIRKIATLVADIYREVLSNAKA